MNINYAKKIVRALADGIDPITGEILPENSVYNSPDVIRALFTLLEEVDKKTVSLQNAGKPWSEAEDKILRKEFYDNLRISEIAKKHGRTYSAIESRLEHIGLKKKSFWFFKSKNP